MEKILHVIPPPPSLSKAKTLDDLYALHLASRGPLSPATMILKDQKWRTFKRIVGSDNPPLTKETMNLYSTGLSLNIDGSNRTNDNFNGHLSTIKAFMKWLYEVGYLSNNIALVLKQRHVPTPLPPKLWTHEEYLKMVEWCSKRENKQTHRFMIILAYHTGMSKFECCHIRWAQIKLNENGPSFIHVQRQKQRRWGGSSYCEIPIIAGSDLHVELLKRKATAHLNYKRFDGIQDYVAQDAPGLYAYGMGRELEYIWKACGMEPGKTFKTFRATFVSNLVNSEAQLALIAKMTGHQNLKTLMLYLNADKQALQQALIKSYEYGSRNDGPIRITAGPDPQPTPKEEAQEKPGGNQQV